jgi:hypothetical protein
MKVPCCELHFDAQGRLRGQAAVPAVRDIFFIAHGWNTAPAAARSLYERFFAEMPDGNYAVAGVFWPSLEFGGGAAWRPELRALADPEDGIEELIRRIPEGAAVLRPSQALNLLSYFRMKHRAGVIGAQGLAPVLARLADRRLHLVGHSFGARLVTAAAHALPAGVRPTSLSLLQAAFSHFAFAEKFDGRRDGAFRAVVAERRIAGPILITHTHADKAVTLAYPIASRIGGQDCAALGGEGDRYGGLGANGAQRTPERAALVLGPAGTRYAFAPGVPHNLRADGVILDHGDIARPETAWAVWRAASASSADR